LIEWIFYQISYLRFTDLFYICQHWVVSSRMVYEDFYVMFGQSVFL
jgi:hypothetical protein